MTSSAAGIPDGPGPWRWPVDPARYDTTPVLRTAEKDAVIELGPGSLRRLARHDPAAGIFAVCARCFPGYVSGTGS